MNQSVELLRHARLPDVQEANPLSRNFRGGNLFVVMTNKVKSVRRLSELA
jgi:hypothetical protein